MATATSKITSNTACRFVFPQKSSQATDCSLDNKLFPCNLITLGVRENLINELWNKVLFEKVYKAQIITHSYSSI